MFEQYSYKKKWMALLVLIGLLSITAYKRSFGVLVAVLKENKELERNYQDLNNKASNVQVLEMEVKQLQMALGQHNNSVQELQQLMVSEIAKNSNSAIFEVKPLHVFAESKSIVYTNQIDITGNCNTLVNLSYNCEKNNNFPKLISLRLYKVKQNNKPNVLHTNLIFQNYENTK